MAIAFEIERATPTVFRRASIQRRQTSDGKFESSFTDITDLIKKWGSFNISIDDIRLNNFNQSDLTLVCRNDQGDFNPETDVNSLWNGFLSRYRTLVKIEAGYINDAGTELPTNSTQGIFILDGEIKINSVKNEATLKCFGLTNVFNEVQASELSGVTATQTASDLFALIRDHTDGSTNFVFREFITSTSWVINATTFNYSVPTTTALDGFTVWEFMETLAEAEGFIVALTRTGGIEFKNRNANTTTSQLALKGEGSANPNVIKIKWRKEAVNKFFSKVRIKHTEADTSSSYVMAGTTTTIDPSSTAWKYGSKQLEFENTFISNTGTAQSVATSLLNTFNEMKQEFQLECKFLPQLEISDRLDLNWSSIDVSARLWDTEDWASDAATTEFDGLSWTSEEGENFDLTAFGVKVLSKKTNLDRFTTELIVREI